MILTGWHPNCFCFQLFIPVIPVTQSSSRFLNTVSMMPTLANAAAQALQRRIVSGEYLQGARLPPQRSLAIDLGISRTSLREAISMLEALGLVHAHPGRGVYVTQRSTNDGSNVPKGPAGVSPESIFQLRYIFEPAAASLAAKRANSVDQLQETQDGLGNALQKLDLVGAAEWDLEFHKRLAMLSGNPSLLEVVQQSQIKVGYSLRLPFANTRRIWETFDEHGAIIKAIADGDSDLARSAIQKHLLLAADRIGIRFEQP
jgi:GntR family transcriptional repressor for pyruvate dehydrogenase complex